MIYRTVLNAIREHGFFGARDAILNSKKSNVEKADLMAAYIDITYMLRYGKSIMD